MLGQIMYLQHDDRLPAIMEVIPRISFFNAPPLNDLGDIRLRSSPLSEFIIEANDWERRRRTTHASGREPPQIPTAVLRDRVRQLQPGYDLDNTQAMRYHRGYDIDEATEALQELGVNSGDVIFFFAVPITTAPIFTEQDSRWVFGPYVESPMEVERSLFIDWLCDLAEHLAYAYMDWITGGGQGLVHGYEGLVVRSDTALYAITDGDPYHRNPTTEQALRQAERDYAAEGTPEALTKLNRLRRRGGLPQTLYVAITFDIDRS
jgi:hypothetical protein